MRADEFAEGDRWRRRRRRERWKGRRGTTAVELCDECVRIVQLGHPTDPQHVHQPADGASFQQIELLATAAILPATLELIVMGTFGIVFAVLPINALVV